MNALRAVREQEHDHGLNCAFDSPKQTYVLHVETAKKHTIPPSFLLYANAILSFVVNSTDILRSESDIQKHSLWVLFISCKAS